MILVDTSVWIDHFRVGEPGLVGLLERGEVLAHPWVTGELALGRLGARTEILGLLDHLPQATVAAADEIRSFIEVQGLPGAGICYVDAQILASTRLTDSARLWTRDRRLHALAVRMRIAFT